MSKTLKQILAWAILLPTLVLLSPAIVVLSVFYYAFKAVVWAFNEIMGDAP